MGNKFGPFFFDPGRTWYEVPNGKAPPDPGFLNISNMPKPWRNAGSGLIHGPISTRHVVYVT
jgi:hypothetical protein